MREPVSAGGCHASVSQRSMQKSTALLACDRRIFAQTDDHIQHALGDFPLRGFRYVDNFVVSNDRDGIAFGVEAYALAGNIVDHDGIERFGKQLLAGVFQSIFGFSGEADDELRMLLERQLRENVGGRLQFQRG